MNKIGKISLRNSSLFLCDMQEKFKGVTSHFDAIVSVSNRMLQAAKLLELPVVVTEQYPKGHFYFLNYLSTFKLLMYFQLITTF